MRPLKGLKFDDGDRGWVLAPQSCANNPSGPLTNGSTCQVRAAHRFSADERRVLPVPANAPYQHLYDLRNPAARASSSEQNQRFDFFVLT